MSSIVATSDQDPGKLLENVSSACRLPSPPGVALRIVDLCRREDSELLEIADLVSSDPALAARLLRFANSPLVGAPDGVASVLEAVLLLGLRATKLTALSFSLPLRDFNPLCEEFDLQLFWANSFLAAVIGRRLVSTRLNVDCDSAFTAGLLAGIGRLVFASVVPTEYGRLLRSADPIHQLPEAERRLFGTDHANLAANLIGEWGLPESLVQSIRHQYHPDKAEEAYRPLAKSVNMSLELVPVVLQQYAGESAPDSDSPPAKPLPEKQIDAAAISAVIEDYRQTAELFDVDLDNPAHALELLAQAHEQTTLAGVTAEIDRVRSVEQNADLYHRATTDSLTGLANRSVFDERLRTALRQLTRWPKHFSLLLIDVDQFKRINDRYGHLVGDDVLRMVAVTLRRVFRDVDMIARYGGDEFVVIAFDTVPPAVDGIALRVADSLRELNVKSRGEIIHITVSIGIAVSKDYAGIPTPADLLADADKQLYIAKRAGRDTWAYADCPHTGNANPNA